MSFVVLPADILAYMQTVDAEFETVNTDVQKALIAGHLDATKHIGWLQFYGSWKAYYVTHQSWVDRLGGIVYDETEKFEKQLIGWRETLRQAGVTVTGPDPVIKPEPGIDLEIGATGKVAMFGAMALIGLYLWKK